jgi:ectoine hydroxylase-related dioxygenase (phytanoyl-CoA dioxygenase family)
VKLDAGQASFHHSLTLHGSFGNTSDQPRRAAVVNVFGDGTVCMDACE